MAKTSTYTDKTGKFAKGNPGRPAGSRHKYVLAIQDLLGNEAEALGRKAIELALAGDTAALRLCVERISPAKKDGPVVFDLPTMQSAEDASTAAGAVLGAVASGDLTPNEGTFHQRVITACVRMSHFAYLIELFSHALKAKPAAQGKSTAYRDPRSSQNGSLPPLSSNQPCCTAPHRADHSLPVQTPSASQARAYFRSSHSRLGSDLVGAVTRGKSKL